MGCCMSSKSERDPSSGDPQLPNSPKLYPPPPKPEPIRSQAAVSPPPPPPPPAEEETVKEVLSETPICPKQPQINIPQEPRCKDQIFITRREEERERERTPEISQASEIYSAADSYSTATTATVTEIRDDEVTSKKRVNRSPVKAPRKRPYNGGRERDREVSQKAPARRLPPAKRELTGQGRTSTPQRNVGSSRVGRDLGERSGRRSRSPATRTAAGGGVKGRAGASPAKVASGGKAASEVGGGGVRSEVKKEEKSENENDSVLMRQEEQQQENESLDNPLVSLECFIFL